MVEGELVNNEGFFDDFGNFDDFGDFTLPLEVEELSPTTSICGKEVEAELGDNEGLSDSIAPLPLPLLFFDDFGDFKLPLPFFFDDFGDFDDFTLPFDVVVVEELSPTTVFFDEVGVDDLDLVLDFLLFDDFGDFGDFTFGTATVEELSPTTVFFDEVGVDDLDLLLDLDLLFDDFGEDFFAFTMRY